MIIRKKTKEIRKQYIDRKLVFRLRRFAIVLIVLTGILIYDCIYQNVNLLFLGGGVLLGFMIGSFVGKYANIHWHEETGKVISKLDRIGYVILILYICFSISRRWIFSHWIHGTALSVTSISIAAGVMTGRILVIRKQIREVLRSKGILPKKTI